MKNNALVWAFIPALAVLLYLPYLNAGYYSDDFLFYYNSPPPHLYQYFFSTGHVAHAYRPLEAILLTLVQKNFGFQTWPIHVMALGAHLLLYGLVIAAATRLGFRPAERVLAGILVLVTQAGPPALLGNDTLSQAMSSAIGAAAVFLFAAACLDRNWMNRRPISWKPYWLSVLSFSASLFFKETVLGFSLILTFIAIWAARMQPGWRFRIGHAARLLAPFGISGVLYFVARIHAGGQIAASDTYKIGVGFNVVRNLALFAVSALNPVSSVSAAVAMQKDERLVPGLAALATLLVAFVVLAGIFATTRKYLVAWLAACSCAALFPAFVLQHVSELYFYNAIPFAALLFSLSLGALWLKGYGARAVIAVTLAVFIGGQIVACRQKASLMYANGKTAARMIAALVPRIRALPPNGRIVLVQPPGERLRYSVYLLQGFDVLDFGAGQLGPIFGRDDVRVAIAEAQAPPDPQAVSLTWDGEALRAYP